MSFVGSGLHGRDGIHRRASTLRHGPSADLNRTVRHGLNGGWPFVVQYSGAAPEQFARLGDAQGETVRFPNLDGALFFACRTLARGGTVLRVDGPDGMTFSAEDVREYCRERA